MVVIPEEMGGGMGGDGGGPQNQTPAVWLTWPGVKTPVSPQ